MLTWTLLLIILLCVQFFKVQSQGILYPRASETREIKSLDGVWNFAVTPEGDSQLGFREAWYKTDLKKLPNTTIYLMPVPSSYNDITQESSIRDHVGNVWYQRKFFVPKSWTGQRVWLRFSAVSYFAQVWINDNLMMYHEIGHLPFHKDVTSVLNYGKSNSITVAVDNSLYDSTVPQGYIHKANTQYGSKLVQSYTFDFFNYAGIHRPVTLYTTPPSYIDDVTISTNVEGTTGIIHYQISFIRNSEDVELKTTVTILDKDELAVGCVTDNGTGTILLEDAYLWWPHLMNDDPGYLYTLKIELVTANDVILDVYRQPFGIRKISWSNTSLLINDHPIYFHGFGRHEDADIRGKGLDFPIIIRDHNLIKWVGGNAYRTSHYPYSEEIMDIADKLGIMIIDECPSVDTDFYSNVLLEKHKNSLAELIRRDKNRPSVIMWSIANEPRTQTDAAGVYFGKIVELVKSLDTSRPVTLATARDWSEDKSAQHLDVISFNRYNSWYSNSGQLDMIVNEVVSEAQAWHKKFNKPVLMSEYGADTYPGLHISPAYVWSEEFQVEMMSKHFEAFDELRQERWFIGEFIWNFADFKTSQTYTRVGGNKKGIFTRDRQPKAGAHHLRRRYFLLARELYNTSLPDDLFSYLAPSLNIRDEL